MKDPLGNFMVGKVWPGASFFPDFFHPSAAGYWAWGLEKVRQLLPFSGIWLDMNEASNFIDGEINWAPPSTDILNNPPYNPSGPGEPFYNKSMRMDALHYGGLLEFNVHTTYGLMESKATFEYLKGLSSLTFILSRSTFYGSG